MKTYDPLIRVSKLNGRIVSAESTLTIEDQRRLIHEAIRQAGGRVGKELLALDVKGFKAFDAPAYQEALERVRRRQSAGPAIAYGDRFMRNWWNAGRYFHELNEADGDFLLGGMPNVDYRSQMGRALLGQMMLSAEQIYFTSKARGENVVAEMLNRKVPNRVPYGYRRNGTFEGRVCVAKIDPDRPAKALQIDPDTAPVVRLIFEWRRDGYSWADISAELERREIPSPTGRPLWTRATLRDVIVNRVYTGVVVFGKQVIPDCHEPIVPLTLWQQAQSSRGVSRSGRLKGGLATGLVVCSGCERTLSIIGNGNGRVSYGCRRSSATGRCPRPVYVDKATVDEFVRETIRQALDQITDPDDFKVIASARELEAAREAAEHAKAELDAYVEHESALGEHFGAGLVTRTARSEAAEEHYASLLAQADEASSLPRNGVEWAALDAEHQRRAARLLIDQIIVLPPVSRSKFAPITDRLDLRFR